jgi:hypothetical protein
VRKGAKEIALVNFQCHPDLLGGTKISADWPGLTNDYLENAFGGKICSILVNGAQGDTNHIRQRWKAGDVLPLRYDMVHHMARTVAAGAMKTWGFCREVPAGKIRSAIRNMKVKVNKAPKSDEPLARKWYKLYTDGKKAEIPGVGMERTVNVAWAGRVLQTRKWPDEKEIPVTVITVGRSLAFGGFPGEPFNDIGKVVKKDSPFKLTIPVCLVNGSRGYFPFSDSYVGGGYESASSPFAPEVADKLIGGQLGLLRRLAGD